LTTKDQEPEGQRYWNEYDHPEDEDTGGYYIYVDPDATVKFPGQELMEAITRKTKQIFGLAIKPDDAASSTAEDDSSDDGTVADAPITHALNYGTISTSAAPTSSNGYFSALFRSLHSSSPSADVFHARRSLLGELEQRQHSTEMTKLRFYCTCLATSIAIDLILGLMTMTSRRKERGVVDIGVLFGTVCTFVLCVVAIASMKTRREKLGWVHQSAVGCIAAAVVGLDVLLLSWVLRI
jgi:hypothetical protein